MPVPARVTLAAGEYDPFDTDRQATLPWLWPTWFALILLWLVPGWFRALAGPDEGRYGEIAREMWATKDFVTPHLNGFVYFEKPPLQYWLNALSIGLFGPVEAALRLYNVVAGLGCAGVVAFVGSRLWGRRIGAMAGFASVAMLWPLVLSAILTLDMGLTLWLFTGVGAYLLSRADPRAETRPRWMLVAWGALGLAMLSKGLIALVLPAGAVLVYCVTTPRQAGAALRHLRWGPGLLLFLAITGPWFWLAAQRNPGFLYFFFVHEHFQRFATDTAQRPGPWWYFLPLLVAGALPLATLLGPAWRVGWQRPVAGIAGREAFASERFLWAWVAFVVFFFSVSRSKLPAYILPVFPALGLLLGRAVVDLDPRRVTRHLCGLGVVLMAAAVALCLDLGRLGRGRSSLLGIHVSEHLPRALIDSAGPWLVAGLGAWGFGLCLAAWYAYRRRLPAALAVTALATAIFGAFLQTGYGRTAHLTSVRDAALVLRHVLPPGSPVYSVGSYEQGLPFYLGQPVILVDYTDEFAYGKALTPDGWLPTVDAFVAQWPTYAHAGAVMRPALYTALRARGVPLCEVYRDPGRVGAIRCPDMLSGH